jgi:hypothetical protein
MTADIGIDQLSTFWQDAPLSSIVSMSLLTPFKPRLNCIKKYRQNTPWLNRM